MTLLNAEELKAALNFDEQFCSGASLLEKIVGLASDQWKREEDWCWADALNYMRFTYGDVAKFVVMACRLHQQVENGGFSQYFENGFASEGDSIFKSHNRYCPLHQEFIRLYVKLRFEPHAQGLLEILIKFSEIIVNNSVDEMPQISENGHEGLDRLDTQYYKLGNQWIEYLSLYTTHWLKTGKDPHEFVS